MHVRLRNAQNAEWSATGKLELELGALAELSNRMTDLVAATSSSSTRT